MSLLLVAGCGNAGQSVPIPAPSASISAPEGYVFPAFSDWIVDDAAILHGSEASALHAKCRQFQQRTGRQLAVVTVRSLGGHTIEDYGLKLGNHWGVGRKGLNDGAMLIVAPNERKVRIEVGRGLERVLTDAEAMAIIDDAIMPSFRAGNVPGGISAGVDGMIRQLSLTDRKAA